MFSTIGKSEQISPPKIAITMGDPAGIGPEVCVKLLQKQGILDTAIPIIFGNYPTFEYFADRLNLKAFPKNIISSNQLEANSNFVEPSFVDFQNFEWDPSYLGKAHPDCGKAAFDYITAAIDFHMRGNVDAIVTGPINKLSLHKAGLSYPGHTEIFAEKTKTENYCMMQYSEPLVCSFATTHVGYSQVSSDLTTDRILEVIELTDLALTKIHGKRPSLVCCGLNPHAGENGLFGNREEEDIIMPAIDSARSNGIKISDPLPPDTCFIPSMRKKADGFICMYHDQGHIPLKALAFDQAVNVTLGLPIIRTSVDHGTAFDIVDQGIADPSSMIAAFKLAALLSTNYERNPQLKPHLNDSITSKVSQQN